MPYSNAPLVIASCHQLLKFHQAFDLLIIDEVDAFPFVDDAILYYAASRSRKEDSSLIYLTATSTEYLEEAIATGQVVRMSLPRRFHNQPLVVPDYRWMPSLKAPKKRKKALHILSKWVRKQAKTGFPLLVFVPEIADTEDLSCFLSQILEEVACVSSKSKDREAIIEGFRKGASRVLVTTTILERGVTFAGVDVFVCDGHHRVFSRATLIQIAGRVGRSATVLQAY